MAAGLRAAAHTNEEAVEEKELEEEERLRTRSGLEPESCGH